MLESMWGALAISMSTCYLTLQPCTWLAEQIWPTASPRDAYISELVLGVRLGCPPAVLVAVGSLVIRWDWHLGIVGRNIPGDQWRQSLPMIP